jgi:Lrp/AsnC family transcriptional regulator
MVFQIRWRIMDRIDKMILTLLQEDATMPVADIARRVGLSTTPCWRRIQKMEEDRVIERRVAILSPEKVNVGVTVFVSITTDKHNAEWLKRFSEVIMKFPEVVSFYRMSGQVDYLMKVVVPDIAAYDAFYKKLVGEVEIADVSSAFAMERIKETTRLPLGFMTIEKPAKAKEEQAQ